MIFLCNIFSGAHGMLKWLRKRQSAITKLPAESGQSQQSTRNGREMADCWWPMLRTNSLSWSLNQLHLSQQPTSKQLGLEINNIIVDIMGWLNNKSFELSSSDAPTLRFEIGWPVPRECNTSMCDPKFGRDWKQRRRCHSQEILVFRGE